MAENGTTNGNIYTNDDSNKVDNARKYITEEIKIDVYDDAKNGRNGIDNANDVSLM